MTNKLYYGDNLRILRDHIASESVDLVYLDPPFNSNATYNVLFRSPAGEQSQAQIEAFEDTWHWNSAAESAFEQVIAALRTGYYETDYGKYEKIQILTVEDLFDGKKPHMPWVDPSVFKKAKRETTEKQSEMEL